MPPALEGEVITTRPPGKSQMGKISVERREVSWIGHTGQRQGKKKDFYRAFLMNYFDQSRVLIERRQIMLVNKGLERPIKELHILLWRIGSPLMLLG